MYPMSLAMKKIGIFKSKYIANREGEWIMKQIIFICDTYTYTHTHTRSLLQEKLYLTTE